MAAWEPFRTIDMDVQARWLHNARSQGKSGHEKSSAAMVAWHKVEKQTQNVLRRSSSPLLQLFEAKILAFLEEIDNGGNRELVLEVALPYHRLLLHGMSQFYGLISRTVASSACDQTPVIRMHITKGTCRTQQQDHFTSGRQLSLCNYLRAPKPVFADSRFMNDGYVNLTARVRIPTAQYLPGNLGENSIELCSKLSAPSLLRQCGFVGSLSDGKYVHAHIVKLGYGRDRFLGNLLIEMYCKCGSCKDGSAVFEKISGRNVFSWNLMIAGYVRQNLNWEALQHFYEMQQEDLEPDKFTYTTVLTGCGRPELINQGRRVHAQIVESRFISDLEVLNSLVNMYGKCNRLLEARNVFDIIQERNQISCNGMLAAYVQNDCCMEAIQLFKWMVMEAFRANDYTCVHLLNACAGLAAFALGKNLHALIVCNRNESSFLSSAIIHMYGMCGDSFAALDAFMRIIAKDVVSWNCVIAAHRQNREAFQIYAWMWLEGMVPNNVTFVNILDVCANFRMFVVGKLVHAHILYRFKSDVVLGNALINMYGKCEDLENAHLIFSSMPERDLFSWNVAIAANGQNGHGIAAIQLYKKMELEKVIPDQVTFVSVLDACASVAALDEGEHIHECIRKGKLDNDVLVGSALINMYGNCGSHDKALNVFQALSVQNLVLWTTMIVAYGLNGFGMEALALFQNMQVEGMTPDHVAFLSTLYACVHALLVCEGCNHFISGRQGLITTPTADEYSCLVDVVSRVGWMDEAEDIINCMHLEENIPWTALLGSCRVHCDLKRAVTMAGYMLHSEIGDVGGMF